MFDWMMIGFLMLAIAIGYGLGRYRGRTRGDSGKPHFAETYYQSLRYILNGQTDSSVDAFIDSLEVNAETLEIHLALGSLLRRKGEVTKAIKIHEHLLHCGKLNPEQLHQAQLELACDFVNAGLLDRAENLFIELVNLESRYISDALQHLVTIYQNEREWEKAIVTANRLASRSNDLGTHELAMMTSHYCCELAQQAIDKSDVAAARNYLQEAFRYHQHSVRASLLGAQLEYDSGAYSEALDLLKKIPVQDPELIKESLDLLGKCFYMLGDREGLRSYLFALLARHPANSVILKLAEIIADTEGEAAAIDFIANQLRKRPSIRTLDHLVDLYLAHSEGKAKENIELLKYLIEKVVAEKPGYICNKCGFTGHKLHWLCPSCKSWNKIKPIKGVAGE